MVSLDMCLSQTKLCHLYDGLSVRRCKICRRTESPSCPGKEVGLGNQRFNGYTLLDLFHSSGLTPAVVRERVERAVGP